MLEQTAWDLAVLLGSAAYALAALTAGRLFFAETRAGWRRAAILVALAIAVLAPLAWTHSLGVLTWAEAPWILLYIGALLPITLLLALGSTWIQVQIQERIQE